MVFTPLIVHPPHRRNISEFQITFGRFFQRNANDPTHTGADEGNCYKDMLHVDFKKNACFTLRIAECPSLGKAVSVPLSLCQIYAD